MARFGYDGPDRFRPLTAWSYVRHSILFSIPVIGWIFLIFFSFSRNVNRRSFARSYWCHLFLVIFIIGVTVELVLQSLHSFRDGEIIIFKLIRNAVHDVIDLDDSEKEEIAEQARTLVLEALESVYSEKEEIAEQSKTLILGALNVIDFGKKEVFKAVPSDTKASVDSSPVGVSPEFKEAMDSYEAFFDKYIEFMEKYGDSSDDIGMLADYLEYMTQFAVTMEKIEAIDESQLSVADDAYYLLVSARIYQKLAEASIQY